MKLKILLLSFLTVLTYYSQAQNKTFGFAYKQDSTTKQYVVTGIIKNSPATKSNVAIGDVLLNINGNTTENRNREEVQALFVLAPDVCKFTISRNGQQKQITITKEDRIKVFDQAKEYGTYTYDDFEYKGELVGGDIKHGTGTLTHKDGRTWKGTFVNNEIEGVVDFSDVKGNIYKGQFTKRNFNGKGVYTFKTGAKYEGEWLNGKYNGKGKFWYANGDVYDGNWVDGKRGGVGKMTFTSGDIYDGEWLNGEFNGKGTIYFNNGNYLKATWVKSKKEGDADWYIKATNTTKRKVYKNDEVVQNDVATNNANAIYKTITYTDGGKYEGYVVNDIPNGKGKASFASGDLYDGDWVNGKKEGKGIYTANTWYYEGAFKNDLRNGYGEYTSNKMQQSNDWVAPDLSKYGLSYKGYWVDNNKEGKGIQVYQNEDTYDGEWKNGKKNGNGVYYNKKENKKYKGFFKDDLKEGKFEIEFIGDGIITYVTYKNDKEFKGVYQPDFNETEKQNTVVQLNPADIIFIVGKIKNLENKSDTANYLVIRGVLKGKITGYSSLGDAKKVANSYAGDEVIMQTRKTGNMLVYEAIVADNYIVNQAILNNQSYTTLSNTPKVDLSYDGIKMDFDRQLLLVVDNEKENEKRFDIIDENGLSLIGDDITGNEARGTRGMSMILDKELLRKNFAEARQSYLYFDKVTSQTPNLEIVKNTRRTSLTKMYRIAQVLREFVEQEMIKYNYTEEDKKSVRGN